MLIFTCSGSLRVQKLWPANSYRTLSELQRGKFALAKLSIDRSIILKQTAKGNEKKNRKMYLQTEKL